MNADRPLPWVGRRRVAVGGRIVDARPGPGGRPDVWATSANDPRRTWRACVRDDGRYFFDDLPPGDYIVHALVAPARGRGGGSALRRVTVAPPGVQADRARHIQLAFDLQVEALPSDPGAAGNARASEQRSPDGGVGP